MAKSEEADDGWEGKKEFKAHSSRMARLIFGRKLANRELLSTHPGRPRIIDGRNTEQSRRG